MVKAFRPREGTSIIRVVNAQGAFRYHVCGGRFTAAQFILSLKRLVTGRIKPVILVVDELPVDKAGSVAHYVQSTRGRLELHFLPPYAPGLHPDQFMWNNLQRGRTRNEQFRRDEPFLECAGKTIRSTSACRMLVLCFYSSMRVLSNLLICEHRCI